MILLTVVRTLPLSFRSTLNSSFLGYRMTVVSEQFNNIGTLHRTPGVATVVSKSQMKLPCTIIN